MKKIRNLLLVSMIFLLSSCASLKSYVSYSVYPIGYLLQRIGGSHIQTISIQKDNNLIQAATIRNDYQDILKNSSYFFHIGHLEPYLDVYANEIKEIAPNIVDLSILNAIYKFERYTLVYANGAESYIESPYYTEDVFRNIDKNELDLLLWMDPIGMLSMAKDITSTLADNNVENAAEFRKNYAKLESELIELDASFQNLSRRLKKENKTIRFVSMSASFGNWQKAYGFQVYPISLSKYGALPTQEQLSYIEERIKADGVEYIAFEPNMTEEMKALFEDLAQRLSLKRVNLSNISSLTDSQKKDNKDYLTLMYENLGVLENMATSLMDKKANEEEATAENDSKNMTEVRNNETTTD